MVWTSPRTWVTAETVTAAIMNTHVRDNLLAIQPGSVLQPVLFSSGDFPLSTATGTGRLKLPFAATLDSVTATVGVAATGADVIVDVNLNAVTMFTTQANRPTITAASQDGVKATPDVTAIASGDVITVDIDQIGSTLPGENLTVILEITVP